MSTRDREIWARAAELIEEYGADAAIHAARKTDALLLEGDLDGAETWQAVIRRIEELQTPSGGTRH